MPLWHDGQGYIAAFHAIRDLSGAHAAYMVGLNEAPVLVDLRAATWRQAALVLLLLLALALLLWALLRSRQRLVEDIRRRDRAEAELAYRQGLFSALFEQSGFLAGILDRDGRLREVNQRALQVIGQPAEAVLGRLFVDTPWWLEQDKPRLRRVIENAANGVADGFEAVHPRTDGELMAVLFHAVPVTVGETRYISVIGVDISDRKRSEQAAAAALAHLREAEVVASVGHWVIELATGRLEWSDEAYRLFGIPSGTPVDFERFQRSVHPDDRAALADAWQAAVHAGSLYEIEHRILVDGQVRWVRERADMARARDGQVVGTVLDITARKAQENAARLAREEIERLSARNALLLDSAGEGIYGADPEGRCVFINPAALNMLGFRAEEVLGLDQHGLFHHHRPDGSVYPHADCPIHQTLRDGQAREVEDAFIRRDGTFLDVHVTVTPMRAGDHSEGAVVVFRDITEHKRLQRELGRLATTDSLTGIANRRRFMEQLNQELARVRRYGHAAALLMLDLDHFKRVNDAYGHATGDAVLRHFTALCAGLLREVDQFGRLGGEEFGVLLPDTDLTGAREFAERLRQTVADTPCVCGKAVVGYTVSIGIAGLDHGQPDADGVLARADRALYRAKTEGRNRCAVDAGEVVAQ